jgi:predicted cytidylate kinase
MKITLSGDLGSGKSSVGRQIAASLSLPHFSAGNLFREIGQISNLDALQTNLAAEDNVEIDHAVDGRTREIDGSVPSFVIDSRMAWHFVSNATKVYLSVSPETAAKRILADGTRGGERYADLPSAIASLTRRRESEVRRYKSLYGTDITDVLNYDLFIVTDDAPVEEIARVIVLHAQGRVRSKFWIPKRRLVPTSRLPQTAAAQPGLQTPLTENLDLPLVIAENFGFYFGDAEGLAAALQFELPMCPYRPLSSSPVQEDVVQFAKRALTEGDLHAWGQAFRVDFSFADQLR